MHRLGYHGESEPLAGIELSDAAFPQPEPPSPQGPRVSDRDLTILCLLSENPGATDREVAALVGLTRFTVAAARARTRRGGLWHPRFELHDKLTGNVPRIVAWGKAANGIAPEDFAALRATLAAHQTSAKFRFRSGMFFALILPRDFARLSLLQADLLDLRTRGSGEFLFRSYDSLEFAPGAHVQRALHKPTALIARLLAAPASGLRPLTVGAEPAPPAVELADLGAKQTQVLHHLLLNPEESLATTAAALGLTAHSVSHIKSRLLRDGVLRHSFKANLAELGYIHILFMGRAHRPISALQNWKYLKAVGGFNSAPLSYCFAATSSAAFFPFRTLEAARAAATTFLAQCEELQMRSSPHVFIGSNAHTRSLAYCAPGDLIGASLTQAAGPAGEVTID